MAQSYTTTDGKRVTIADDGTKTYTSPTSSAVPVSVMETPPPQTPLPQVDVSTVPEETRGAVGVAQSFLNTQNKAVENAQAPVTASENELRRLMGIEAGAPDYEANLRDSYNVDQQQQKLNEYLKRVENMTADIEAFDDNTLLGEEQLRQDGAGRDITKNVFSAQANQRRLQRSIERTAKASELRAVTASANLQMGNIKLAEEQIARAMEVKYAPIRQAIENEKFFIEQRYQTLSNAQQAQADARLTLLNTQIDRINTAEQMVQSAVVNGYASPAEVERLALLDPEEQIVEAQKIIANGIRAEAYASRSGISAPTVKTINGVDMQWNSTTGQWEPIASAGSVDQAQKSLDQLAFLRNTIKQIIGGEGEDGTRVNGLYTASGASGISKFLGDKLIGDTKFRQLEAYTNTLRTNVMALMTDPSVKKFFGPQMSNADVTLMTAAGTTLNPNNQSPAQLKAEATRLDTLIGRMETAVRTGMSNQVSGTNIITAPDGTQVEIID